ncbi:MAG: TetR/AcrR family transcriptional regulator, partial [Flavimaricola sp.]|nr:TetR/AcrR family transcriptional regulator [Flavimaricola sp.]
RHGCAAAVQALAADKMLRPDLNEDVATDLLWTLLSVENWEQLVRDCGWSQKDYESQIGRLAEAALLAPV